ncbi:MAG: deacylase, partial [Desulfovibrio sp.]|nr:deacylase [Desulfovibrio sp.]
MFSTPFFLRRFSLRRRKLIFITALLPLFYFAVIFSPASLFAFPLDFNTFKLGSGDEAVLIVGGIQGDEPGGFSAATLLATRYEIKKGCLWVVPNLNFPSIIKRSRGLYG